MRTFSLGHVQLRVGKGNVRTRGGVRAGVQSIKGGTKSGSSVQSVLLPF